MKKHILLFSLLVLMSIQVMGQAESTQYRRSSLCTMLINHTDQQYADEIRSAFLEIPTPDRFNDHNLSVRVINMDSRLKGATLDKENQAVTDFLNNNQVASRLIGRWFNRDGFTGACNMDLVKERGLYNATEFDKMMAQHSARGTAMLEDAGEDLIGHTYVVVNDIRYIDQSKGTQAAGITMSVLGAVAGAFFGSGVSNVADKLADMIESIKGFSVSINSFLYRLEWEPEQAALFYQEQYGDGKNLKKRDNFEAGRGSWKLTYVGKVESKGSNTSFMGINEDHPTLMVRKACQRALDKNISDLQHEYEDFRSKSPLISTEPLTAYIGMKEGVTENSKFEVLQPVEDEQGHVTYQRVGVIQPIKNLIWDNRFMAAEEGAAGSSLGYTTFRVVSGKGFYKGMLIREIGKN